MTASPVVALDWTGVSVLCLTTPATPRGGTDLTCMRPALGDIRRELTIAAHRRRAFAQSLVLSTDPPGTGDDFVSRTFEGMMPAPALAVGTAMCPEFFRASSRVGHRFNSPFLVLGTADQRATEMFPFLNRKIRLTASTQMGRTGRFRFEEELGWSHQRDVYIGEFDALVGRRRVRG